MQPSWALTKVPSAVSLACCLPTPFGHINDVRFQCACEAALPFSPGEGWEPLFPAYIAMLDNDSLAATFAQPPCSGLEALETLSGRPFFRLTQLKLAARALLKHGSADARDCVCRRSSAQAGVTGPKLPHWDACFYFTLTTACRSIRER